MAPALPNPRVVPHISADHFAEHVAFICHVFNFFVVDIFAVFCPYRHFDEGVASIKRLFDFFDTFHIFAKLLEFCSVYGQAITRSVQK